jgi:hypothetical protein
LVERIQSPSPRVTELESTFHAFQQDSVHDGTQDVWASEDGCSHIRQRPAGSVRAIRAHWWRGDTRSQIAVEEAVKIDGRVPSWQQLDAVLHLAQPDLATFRRWSGELGDGFAVTDDDDFVAALDRADEFGKTVLGFGDADVHGIEYSYNRWLFEPGRRRLRRLVVQVANSRAHRLWHWDSAS